jgi:RNA polymerase sigma-70 factor (ECF subfamily)
LPTDLELFALAQRYDVSAFEALFRRYHQPLCDFVVAYVGVPAVAEDVVQDLFAALWTQSSSWRIHSTLRAYLFAAARNRALKHLRTEHRIVDLGDDHSDLEREQSADPAFDVQVELESAESIRLLQGAIADLPPRTRLAVTLRWGQEMSHAEIAEAMDISMKGVEKLLSVGMTKLRSALRPR